MRKYIEVYFSNIFIYKNYLLYLYKQNCNMELEDLMIIIEETFSEEIFAELDNFAGDPFATIKGKEEFLNSLREKLDGKLFSLTDIMKERLKPEINKYKI